MVGRRPQLAASKLACIVLSSAISYRSRISTIVVCSRHMVSKWWYARGPLVVFKPVDVPYPIRQPHYDFIFRTLLIIQYDFYPLSDPDAGLSVPVCDVDHTYFHVGLCCRKFVLSLFGEYPGLCTIYHSWQHTRVVHLSLQADGKDGFVSSFFY